MSTCKSHKTSICCLAVFLLVVLRIAIGWHFFYEGIHKFDERHGFSAKGFLGVAKGPTAPLFFMMLPDLSGEQRLVIDTVKDEKGKDVKTFIEYENAWNTFKERFLARHELNDDQKKKIDVIFNQYLTSLRDGAADVGPEVAAWRKSMERFHERNAEIRNDTQYEQKRRWDEMMGYRKEADGWINMLDGMSTGLQSDMARVVSPQLAGEGGQIVTQPEKAWVPNPIVSTHMRTLDLAVTWGLTAIGLCMILGFCTRLACLGGVAFLFNVFLTTWPVPGVYPELPDMIGHFLYISKDVIELIAMLALAAMPSGRWGGLDYFLWHCGGKKLAQRFGLVCCCDDEPKCETKA